MDAESTTTDHHDETAPASNAHAYPWGTADTARAACDDLAVTTHADAAETTGEQSTEEPRAEKMHRALAHPFPQVIDLTTVQPRQVSYLWKPYFPAKFCLLEGKPDVGKSQLYLYLAARITQGLPFFTEDAALRRAPGTVIIVQAEDDIEDTFLPRLLAAGADISKVIPLKSTWSQELPDGSVTTTSMTFQDLGMLDTAALHYKPQLIVIDPFNAFVAGKSTQTSWSMRPLMQNLMALARRHACPVLAIRHLTKKARGAALDAGAGSHDIIAASRSMMLMARDPHDPSQYVFAHAKSNTAVKGDALTYRLVHVPEFDAPRLEFTGFSPLTADDLVNPQRIDTTVEAAEAFLHAWLAKAPRPSHEVKKAAQRRGFSRRVLDAAKKNVGVQTKGVYVQGKRGAQEHVWGLPTPE